MDRFRLVRIICKGRSNVKIQEPLYIRISYGSQEPLRTGLELSKMQRDQVHMTRYCLWGSEWSGAGRFWRS